MLPFLSPIHILKALFPLCDTTLNYPINLRFNHFSFPFTKAIYSNPFPVKRDRRLITSLLRNWWIRMLPYQLLAYILIFLNLKACHIRVTEWNVGKSLFKMVPIFQRLWSPWNCSECLGLLSPLYRQAYKSHLGVRSTP